MGSFHQSPQAHATLGIQTVAGMLDACLPHILTLAQALAHRSRNCREMEIRSAGVEAVGRIASDEFAPTCVQLQP
eukprot:scaffold155351_cov31-Tisochrysis_lutea.AAC.4